MAKEQTTAEAPPKRRKQKRVVSEGVVHVHSTFNNTLVTITDTVGNVVAWSSAGSVGSYDALWHTCPCSSVRP